MLHVQADRQCASDIGNERTLYPEERAVLTWHVAACGALPTTAIR